MSRNDGRFDFSDLAESRRLSRERPKQPKLNADVTHHLKQEQTAARRTIKASENEGIKLIAMLAYALSPQRDIEKQTLFTACEAQSRRVMASIEAARRFSLEIDKKIASMEVESARANAERALKAGLFHRRCLTASRPPLPDAARARSRPR